MQECRDESEIYIYQRIQLLNKKEECVYLSANRFSMAWEKGIQVPYPFFVFAWHWKTDLNFAVCFSFSPNFEKRFWTSYFVFRFRITLKNGHQYQFPFFVFASLWKTDMNFVFRFRITLKNGLEFRFSFSLTLKNRSEFRLSFWHDLKNGSLHQFSHLKPRPPPRGLPGHSLFM